MAVQKSQFLFLIYRLWPHCSTAFATTALKLTGHRRHTAVPSCEMFRMAWISRMIGLTVLSSRCPISSMASWQCFSRLALWSQYVAVLESL